MKGISIIMPVYNTPIDLLSRCIQSILNQTYPSFELLLIDDGSSQEYAEYLNNLPQIDDRICIYHQKNMGPGIARNYGLRLVRGDVVAFIDSDDEIMPNYFEQYLYMMEKYSLDIIIGGYFDVYANNTIVERKALAINKECFVISSKLLYIEKVLTDRVVAFPKLCCTVGYPWGKLIKKEIACKASFLNVPYEDLIYNLYLSNYAYRIGFIPSSLYNYYVRKASVTRTTFSAETYYERLRCIKEYIEENAPSMMNAYYGRALLFYVDIMTRFSSSTKLVKSIKSKAKSIAESDTMKSAFVNINSAALLLKPQNRLLVFLVKRQYWNLVAVLFWANEIKHRCIGKKAL